MAQLDTDQILLEKLWFIGMSTAALIILLMPQLYIENIDSLSSLKQFISSTGDPRMNVLTGLWGLGVVASAVCALYFITALRFTRHLSKGMQYVWCLSFFPTLLAIIVVSNIYTRAAQNTPGEDIVVIGLLYLVPLIVGIPLLIVRQGRRNYKKQQAHQQSQSIESPRLSFWRQYRVRLMVLGTTTFLIIIASPNLYSMQYFVNLAIGLIFVIALFSICDWMFRYVHYYWGDVEVKEFLNSRVRRK